MVTRGRIHEAPTPRVSRPPSLPARGRGILTVLFNLVVLSTTKGRQVVPVTEAPRFAHDALLPVNDRDALLTRDKVQTLHIPTQPTPTQQNEAQGEETPSL